MNTRYLIVPTLIGATLLLPVLGGCDGGGAASTTQPAPEATPTGAAPTATVSDAISNVNIKHLPLGLQMKIGSARQDVVSTPDDPLKLADLGALYYVHGFPAAARACFERAYQLKSDEFVLAYTLGLAREQAGDLPAAAEAFRAALKINGTYEPAQRRLAQILEKQGKADEAAQQRTLSSRPDDAVLDEDWIEQKLRQRGYDLDGLLALALELAKNNDFEHADQWTTEAASVDDTGLPTRTTRARIEALKGQPDAATHELRSILLEKPDYVPAKVELARVLLTVDKPTDEQRAEGEKLLRVALDAEPDNVQALGLLGNLLIQQQRGEELIPVLERARQSATKDPEVFLAVGELYYTIQRRDDSIAAVRKALELRPNLARARRLLGTLLYVAGDAAGARREWNEAIRIAPTLVSARLALFESYYNERDYPNAIRCMREGLTVVPASMEMANALAWVLATCPDDQLRNGQEAVQLAEAAARATRFFDYGRLDTLAAAYAEIGRFDEALKWINIAVGRAREAGREELAKTYAARRALYDEGKPYREGL